MSELECKEPEIVASESFYFHEEIRTKETKFVGCTVEVNG